MSDAKRNPPRPFDKLRTTPPKEGCRTIPSSEGCRVSGGVGSLSGAREQKGEGCEPSHIARFKLDTLLSSGVQFSR